MDILRKTAGFTAALLMFAALLCQGCSRQESASFRGAPSKMVIGVARGETATLLFEAERMGYLKQYGLDATLKVFDSGVAAVKALHEGEINLAAPAEFVVASNIEKHPHMRIIAAINKIDSIEVIARKDRNISRPPDLKGKRIAVTLTSIAEFYLAKYLNYQRLTLKDVILVNLTPAMMEKAMADGSVDAAIVWNPVAERIKNSLGSNYVSWSAQLDGRWHLVLVTRDDFIQKDPAALTRLLKALIIAEKSLAADPAPAQRDLAARFGLPEKYFASVWGQNQFKVFLDRSLLLTLEEQSRWIQQSRGANQAMQPNYLQYLYLDSLKAARPESVTIIN